MSSEHEARPSHDDPPTLTFRDVTRFFRRYSAFLWIVTIASTLLAVATALVTYFVSPATAVTTLRFQLEFEGAERGAYPNGTSFSPAEILSTPNLLAVYKAAGIEQLIDFDKFRGSVFVVEDGEDIDRLMRAYEARLADPRLSPVERERIESEFIQKKESLSKSSYSVNLITSARVRSLSRSTRSQLLSSILAGWAEDAVKRKGVELYEISVLSTNVFDESSLIATSDLVSADMLRSKVNRVLKNLEDLQEISGAKTLRTSGDNGLSLSDLQAQLKDTKEFRLQPLIVAIAGRNPRASLQYLNTRLNFTELEKKEAEGRVAAVRDVLSVYDQQRSSLDTRGGSPSAVGGQTIIPQVDEGFLDRLLGLTTSGADLAYRQDLATWLRWAGLAVNPLRMEVEYYSTMAASLQSGSPGVAEPKPDEIEATLQEVRAEAILVTRHMNEIYALMSRNLNPSTAFYSAGSERTRIERSVSVSRLAVLVGVFLILLLPTMVIATFLYDRLSAAATEL